MHFVAQLYSNQQEILKQQRSDIRLRGYDASTWVKPELSDIKLPVNVIAYNLCPTARDLYFERVRRITSPQSWERYEGKVIDYTYKAVHRKCEEYVIKQQRAEFSLALYIARNHKRIIECARQKHARELSRIIPSPRQNKFRALEGVLKKIIKSEASLASGLINFEVGRTAEANVKGIFDEYLDFNTDLVLKSPHLGFGEKATPDFLYRHEVIGDIKTGRWQEFYIHTAVAYALAYEEHTKRDMNYGVILHAQFPSRKNIPIYPHVSIEFIDDRLRHAFIAIRDRKLQIIKEGEDPGKPESRDKCDTGCPFLQRCWSGTHD